MKRRLSFLIIAALLLFASTGNCLDFNKYRGFEPETVAYAQLPGAASTHAALAAIDTNIRAIKYGSGITLVSVTTNISAVDLTAFLSNPSTDLRPYCNAGWKATITDASAKYNVAILGARGTGEGSTELLADTSFDNAGSWTAQVPGWSIAGGKGVAANVGQDKNLFQAIASPIGRLVKFTAICDSYSGGNARFRAGASGSTVLPVGTGTRSAYITVLDITALLGLWRNNAIETNLTATYTDLSCLNITTPSALGCTLLNAPGGAQSFISKDAAFTYNAASYTITITKE